MRSTNRLSTFHQQVGYGQFDYFSVDDVSVIAEQCRGHCGNLSNQSCPERSGYGEATWMDTTPPDDSR